MDYDEIGPIDTAPIGNRSAAIQPSAIERQLRRLVVSEPAASARDKRLDVLHDPDLELLWGGQV